MLVHIVLKNGLKRTVIQERNKLIQLILLNLYHSMKLEIMWIFTKSGFVSAVSNPDGTIKVRARDQASLEPLSEKSGR